MQNKLFYEEIKLSVFSVFIEHKDCYNFFNCTPNITEIFFLYAINVGTVPIYYKTIYT